MIDDIEDAIDDLDDAAQAVGERDGPLDEPELGVVTRALDSVLATIDRILDPNQYPSLSPPDAGDIDPDAYATTLREYADETLILAKDAEDEAHSALVDHKVIGSRLKTIEYLITRESPHSYRSIAGTSTGL